MSGVGPRTSDPDLGLHSRARDTTPESDYEAPNEKDLREIKSKVQGLTPEV
jgi:hypothetical protein